MPDSQRYPLKLCMIKYELEINFYNLEELLFSIVHLYCRKTIRNFENEKLLNREKRQYLPYYWSTKGFKATVENSTFPYLHGGPLEITLTVPLKPICLGDRFCSDIENQGKDLKELKSVLVNQEKQVQENSRTLKDITKDSIGKIKEVATNCIQIEKNIRLAFLRGCRRHFNRVACLVHCGTLQRFLCLRFDIWYVYLILDLICVFISLTVAQIHQK